MSAGVFASAVMGQGGGGGGDPHWANVVSLLHFDGDIIDETERVWSTTGSAAYPTATDSKFGGSSLRVENDTSDIYTAGMLTSGEACTIEGFIKVSSGVNVFIAQTRNASNGDQYLGINTGGRLRYVRQSGVGAARDFETGSGTMPYDEWNHFAFVYDGTTIRLFANGVMGASSTTTTGWVNAAEPFKIGRNFVPMYSSFRRGMNGFLDEVRITKGVARYTSDFTPPSAPFPNGP